MYKVGNDACNPLLSPMRLPEPKQKTPSKREKAGSEREGRSQTKHGLSIYEALEINLVLFSQTYLIVSSKDKIFLHMLKGAIYPQNGAI